MENLFFSFSMNVLEVHSLKLSANLMKLILSLLMPSVNASLELKPALKSVLIYCCIFLRVAW